MNRSDLHEGKFKRWYMKFPYNIGIICFILFMGLFIYSKVSINIVAPKKDLGEKVVIHMPAGKTVFTYENLIIKKNGKLYYKGERNTIDLTGGTIVYENWK